MKKYLMSGIAAIALCAAFTSCSKGDLYDQEQINQNAIAKAEQDYAVAFEKAFGKVGANVDWGFGNPAGTRTAYTNSNMWESDGLSVPADITAREREVVMDWFRTHENPQSETVDLHNYFIQNVGYTDHTYPGEGVVLKDNNGHDVTITNPGKNHMDYIFVGPGYYWNGSEATPITWDEGDDHVNNFNANSGEIQYMKYSGSEWFGFHDSYGNGSSTAGHGNNGKYCEKNRNFVIRFIEVDGVVGCYVGFNYESGKTSENWHLNPDGFFDDRVIKLVPGDGIIVPPTSTKYRVIAEDLNSREASDYDFNDVVFDVEPNTAKTAAKIVLRACGGIYKLTVGDANHEVHEAFGQYADPTTGLYPMINTNPWDPDYKVTLFEAYSGDFSDANIRSTINGIEIRVYKPGTGEEGALLTARTGQAACKILVDDTFEVVTERTGIADKNTNFHKYVQGYWDTQTQGFWWRRSANAQ